ncbi:tetratricopeptide repeat protein [Micromonosporaceae bacterium Da 78-11]
MSDDLTAEDAYFRAQRLAEVGRYEDAERAVRTGLAVAPGSGPLLTLLASILRLRRDYAGALSVADAAAAAAPELPDAHAERAENLIALIRSGDAVEAAREAVRLDPLEPSGHLILARALAAADDFEQARAAARHGLSLRPGSVEGLLTVADVERDAGNRDAATAAAEAALAISPAHPYGRWLIAMLDAERLRVRRSIRGLRDVARDNPARPDVISMTWPIRGVLRGLRRGLAVGAGLICALLLIAHWWPPTGSFARILSGVLAAVLAGFAARVLIPAGRLPWRSLRLLPRLMRRSALAGLSTVGVAVALLVAHAVTAYRLFAVLALAAAPLLWIFGFVELLGAGLNDPGFAHALRRLGGEFRDWWHTTKKELREVWQDPPPPGRPADPGDGRHCG